MQDYNELKRERLLRRRELMGVKRNYFEDKISKRRIAKRFRDVITELDYAGLKHMKWFLGQISQTFESDMWHMAERQSQQWAVELELLIEEERERWEQVESEERAHSQSSSDC
jgi:hypothetical protein